MKIRSLAVCLTILAGWATLTAFHLVFKTFESPQGLKLVEQAVVVDDVLRVCPAVGYSKGAAWYGRRVGVGGGFVTRFTFQYTEQHAKGGDGFAFVIQNHDREAVGSLYGGALGYSHWPACGEGGIPASLAIEFDGWMNIEWNDPDDNHLSVHTGGTGPNCAHEDYSLGRTSAIPDLHTEDVHLVTIRYFPGRLSIWVDDPLTPALTVGLDLEETLGLTDGRAFVGFTAGTGQEVQNHDILNWTFFTPGPFGFEPSVSE